MGAPRASPNTSAPAERLHPVRWLGGGPLQLPNRLMRAGRGVAHGRAVVGEEPVATIPSFIPIPATDPLRIRSLASA